MNKLPVYKLDIDSLDFETGMDAISLVEEPAIEIDFLRFSKTEPIKLSYDESQHIISGPAILADTPIYRENETYGPHYVIFDKDLIKKLMLKYSKFCLNNSVNIEHSDWVGGIYMVESYLKDVQRGINPIEFTSVPDGSWFVSYKVVDLELWDKIQKGDVKGFSIEGLFCYDSIIGSSEFSKSKKQPDSRSSEVATTTSFDEYVDKLIDEISK